MASSCVLRGPPCPAARPPCPFDLRPGGRLGIAASWLQAESCSLPRRCLPPRVASSSFSHHSRLPGAWTSVASGHWRNRGSCLLGTRLIPLASEVVLVVKHPPANAGDLGPIPGQEDPLEEEMATHSSILAWIKPHGQRSLHSMGLKKTQTRLSKCVCTHTHTS